MEISKNILIKNDDGYSILSVYSHSHLYNMDDPENYFHPVEVPMKNCGFHLIENDQDHDIEVNRILNSDDYLIFNDMLEFDNWYKDWNPIKVDEEEKQTILKKLGFNPKDDMWELPKYYQSKKGDKFLSLNVAWEFITRS